MFLCCYLAESCCAQFSFIILSDMPNAIVQCVDLVRVTMLSVVVLSVLMQNVIRQSVIRLSVMVQKLVWNPYLLLTLRLQEI